MNRSITQWLAGGDPAGRHVGNLQMPNSVADGTLDRQAGSVGQWSIAHIASCQGNPLSDAGHVFLFQDTPQFILAIERILG